MLAVVSSSTGDFLTDGMLSSKYRLAALPPAVEHREQRLDSHGAFLFVFVFLFAVMHVSTSFFLRSHLAIIGMGTRIAYNFCHRIPIPGWDECFDFPAWECTLDNPKIPHPRHPS